MAKEIRCHFENLAKHGVHPEEVRECFRKGIPNYVRKVGDRRYQRIAQTAYGRYLDIIYREDDDSLFVYHAMDARPRDIRLLRRRGKRR